MRFEVDSSAMQFNGYEATIRYRPAVVEFLPPVIEGMLMTGACNNRFTFLSEPDDSTLTFTHVIPCAGQWVNGPGILSTYRFRAVAGGTSPLTIVSDPDRTFFDAGECVSPNHPTFPRQVVLHEAAIVAGGGSGIAPGEAPAAAPLRPAQSVPNPFHRPAATIAFELGAAVPVRLEVFDATGRLVWTEGSVRAAGSHHVRWDGRAMDGALLPSGVYLYRLAMPGAMEARKMTLLE